MRKTSLFIAGFVAAAMLISYSQVAYSAWDRVVFAAKYLIAGAGTTKLGLATMRGHTAAEDVLHIAGASGQTADLIDATNFAGSTLFKVDAGGDVTATTIDGLAVMSLDDSTSDICGLYDSGSVFYNSTGSIMCYCNVNGDDLKIDGSSAACY